MGFTLEFRILGWSASKEEIYAASKKYELQVCVLSGYDRITHGLARDAVSLFTDALSIDSSCVLAFLGRAMAYEQMYNYQQAHQNYDSAVRFDQHCVLGLCGRGWCYLAIGETQAALDDYAKAISLAPTHSCPQNGLANARIVMGDTSGALLAYNKAIKLARSDRERASVVVNRGVLRYLQGLWGKAGADLRKGIGLYEDLSCWSHFLLWHCHARSGKRSKGDVTLNAYLSSLERRFKCKGLDWYLALGGLLLGKVSEKTTLSLLDMHEPVCTQERHCEAHFHLGSLALLNGSVGGARKHFRKCLDTKFSMAPEYVCARAELSRLGK
jgi:tetratricopeptide (TPR) repeat protein